MSGGKVFLDLCFWQNIGMFCTYLFSVILYTESYSSTLSLLDFLKKIGAYKSRRDSQSRSLVMEWRPQFSAECYTIDHHKSIVKDLHNIRRGVQYLYALMLGRALVDGLSDAQRQSGSSTKKLTLASASASHVQNTDKEKNRNERQQC